MASGIACLSTTTASRNEITYAITVPVFTRYGFLTDSVTLRKIDKKPEASSTQTASSALPNERIKFDAVCNRFDSFVCRVNCCLLLYVTHGEITDSGRFRHSVLKNRSIFFYSLNLFPFFFNSNYRK